MGSHGSARNKVTHTRMYDLGGEITILNNSNNIMHNIIIVRIIMKT